MVNKKQKIKLQFGRPTWNPLRDVVFPAELSLLLTHDTISRSTIGLPVLASWVKIDSV